MAAFPGALRVTAAVNLDKAADSAAAFLRGARLLLLFLFAALSLGFFLLFLGDGGFYGTLDIYGEVAQMLAYALYRAADFFGRVGNYLNRICLR